MTGRALVVQPMAHEHELPFTGNGWLIHGWQKNDVAECDCGQKFVARCHEWGTNWVPLRWYHFKAHWLLREAAK